MDPAQTCTLGLPLTLAAAVALPVIRNYIGLLLFLSKSADGRSLSRSSHWRWLSFTDALWRDEAGEGGSGRMTLGGPGHDR
jgi:hypothetical protein